MPRMWKSNFFYWAHWRSPIHTCLEKTPLLQGLFLLIWELNERAKKNVDEMKQSPSHTKQIAHLIKEENNFSLQTFETIG